MKEAVNMYVVNNAPRVHAFGDKVYAIPGGPPVKISDAYAKDPAFKAYLDNKNGLSIVDDPEALKEERDAKVAAKEAEAAEDKTLLDMTQKELIAYAKDKGIALPGNPNFKKKEVLAEYIINQETLG
jgi:tagatose-1,6-bisphosphate aldolase non-catalytic subunit AgaZ/GatZ